MKRCIIVGAGEFKLYDWHSRQDDYIIAADGGYRYLAELDVVPHMVIGDMDSLENNGSEISRENEIEIRRLPVEKDDTDMLAAIKEGLKQGCGEFILYGSLGGRIDHTIANIQCLLYLHNHGAKGVLYGGHCSLELLCKERKVFPKSMQGLVSVFAYGGEARGVTEQGLKYSLNHAVVSPDFPIGISNEFIGQESSIEVEEGMLLVYVDKYFIDV